MDKGLLQTFKRNFLTGLALLFPAVLSIFVVLWLFGIVSAFTDQLLRPIPRRFRIDPETLEIYWHWRALAFLVAVLLVAAVGRLTRNYVGRKMIEVADSTMLRIPLLNKIYSTLKQVNEAFTSGKKSSFKQVVLIEFPRQGLYSVGFITGEQHDEIQAKTHEKVVSVFVPTTPNPTSGWLVLVPESKAIRLDMPVSDGVKFIISLGSVAPAYTPRIVLEPAEPVVPEIVPGGEIVKAPSGS